MREFLASSILPNLRFLSITSHIGELLGRAEWYWAKLIKSNKRLGV
jgi:hypothetical protein